MTQEININQETAVVAENAAKLLKELGLSIRDAAAKADIKPATLGAMLNKTRNISFDMLTKLSVAFGVSTDYLLGLSVADDVQALATLKEEKLALEEKVANLYTTIASLPFGLGERNNRLEEVAAAEKHLKLLNTRIARSEQEPLKVPVSFGEGIVFRPHSTVRADCSAVLKDGTGNGVDLPPDSVLYMERTRMLTPGELYTVRENGRLRLTREPDKRDDVLGEVTYLLLPARAYLARAGREEATR